VGAMGAALFCPLCFGETTMEFGMYCAQTGASREATCASQALDAWQNAPRSAGTWVLVIDGIEMKEEHTAETPNKWGEGE